MFDQALKISLLSSAACTSRHVLHARQLVRRAVQPPMGAWKVVCWKLQAACVCTTPIDHVDHAILLVIVAELAAGGVWVIEPGVDSASRLCAGCLAQVDHACSSAQHEHQ